MALILDTARFKYPPHWVPLDMLYKCAAGLWEKERDGGMEGGREG